MTADDIMILSKMLDEKLAPISQTVDSHDRDIRSVKAVIGFLVVVGGLILVIAGAVQGWVSVVDHVHK